VKERIKNLRAVSGETKKFYLVSGLDYGFISMCVRSEEAGKTMHDHFWNQLVPKASSDISHPDRLSEDLEM
jgi:hypothetical protein